MTKPVTLRVVAEAAGVSIAAVSQALAGTGSLSADTRDRVRALAHDLGYVPNRTASALRSGRTKTIGFVLDMDAHEEPGDRRAAARARLLSALVVEAAAHDHTVTMLPGDRPDLLRGSQIDVLYHPGAPELCPMIDEARTQNMRVVTHDLAVDGALTIDTGVADAVRASLDLLARGGARDIGFLGDAPGSLRTTLGESAYWEWCAARGADGYVAMVDARRRTLVQRVRALQDDGVDAIVAFSEDGPEIFLHLDAAGVVLPRDLQLVTLCTSDCELNARLGVTRACVHPSDGPSAMFDVLGRGVLAPPTVTLPWQLVPGSTTRA